MTPIEIIHLIKARRASLGLSQQEVADKAGVPRQTYSCIERGSNLPNLALLHKICTALDLSIKVEQNDTPHPL